MTRRQRHPRLERGGSFRPYAAPSLSYSAQRFESFTGGLSVRRPPVAGLGEGVSRHTGTHQRNIRSTGSAMFLKLRAPPPLARGSGSASQSQGDAPTCRAEAADGAFRAAIVEPQSWMALLCGSAEISLSLQSQSGSDMVNKRLIRAILYSESLDERLSRLLRSI
jgi:hypothetical protein